MKDIEPKLISLFKEGYCTPQIAQIAKKIKEPGTTIHYNIKRMEKEGKIKSYKAVFDYKKIGEGYCTYLLVNLGPENYAEPEKIAQEIAEDEHVESIDVCTGDYELIIKIRAKDIDEYYLWAKSVVKRYGFAKSISMASLKQIKSEFVIMD